MLGKRNPELANPKLPFLVHDICSTEAFGLAQKVWDTNGRSVGHDAETGKDLHFFSFDNPSCAVWLQRDQGRTDVFEFILQWQGEGAVTELYVLRAATAARLGDDGRVKSLLSAILASPATVPVR